jgi:hypothetical protein
MSGLEAVLDAVGSWAWARHHNVLSWYIRPLFLLPLAWAAYRRSAAGIVATLLALATSMAWFPAPGVPDPKVEEFLAFEKEWLTGHWDATKIALSLLPPAGLAAYCIAFWRRSLRWGLLVLGGMAFSKIAWSTIAGEGGGAVVLPALVGLAVGAAVIALAARRLTSRRALAVSPALDTERARTPSSRP